MATAVASVNLWKTPSLPVHENPPMLSASGSLAGEGLMNQQPHTFLMRQGRSVGSKCKYMSHFFLSENDDLRAETLFCHSARGRGREARSCGPFAHEEKPQVHFSGKGESDILSRTTRFGPKRLEM